MSEYECMLVTVYYESGKTLIRCALKVHQDLLPSDFTEFPMEYIDKIHELLPLHVKSCGNIVEIQRIFECETIKHI